MVFPIRLEGGKTHCSSVSEAVGSYHPQAHVYEHGDLVSPSHGDIGEAMDLWRIYQRVCGFLIELAAYQEDGSFVLS